MGRQMGFVRIAIAGAAALLAVCATPVPNRAVKIEIRAESFSGDNGVRVFTIPDDESKYVGFHARYAVGSVQDPPGKAGLAHLVEHLMFARSAVISGRETSIGTLLDEITIFNNAVTTPDYTHYWALVRPDKLSTMFEIETARILGGCKAIPVEVFELEREVVANEQREKASGDFGRTYPALLHAIYAEHPYGRDTGGSPEELAAITYDDVCGFMARHYNARNLAFYVTGGATPDHVRQTAIPWLGKLPAVEAAPAVAIPAIHPARKVVNLTLDVEVPSVYAAWRLPVEHTAYSLVGEVSEALESRLSFFVYTYDIGRSVDVFTLGGDRAPEIVAQVELASSSKESEALEALRDSASYVERQLPKDEQDAYSRDMIDARSARSSEILVNFERLGSRGFISADAIDKSGGSAFLISEIEHLPAISVSDLRSMAGEMLDPDKAVFVSVKPSGSATAHGGSSRDVTHESNRWRIPVDPADAGKPLDIATPPRTAVVEDYKLSNGLRVVLAQAGTMPLVRASLVFSIGAVHSPAKNPIIASFAGGWQGGDVSDDFTVYGSSGLSSRLDYLIKDLAYGKRGIDFDQEMVEIYRNNQAATLKVPSVRARAQFFDALYRNAFGSSHPYARVRVVEPKHLKATNRSDLRDFGDRYYGANNATLIVVGKFDVALAKAYIKDSFDHWEKRTQAKAVAEPADPDPETVAVRDDTKTQLEIVMVHPGSNGVSLSSSAKRMVARAMLAGRLRRMREELGITYGAQAEYTPQVGPGLWTITSEVDPKRGADGIKAIADAIASLSKSERDAEFDADFVLARRLAIRTVLFDLSDSAGLLARLRYAVEYGLPLDHHEFLVKSIAAVTPDQVHAVFTSELDPSRRILGIYGPGGAVTATLAAMKQTSSSP